MGLKNKPNYEGTFIVFEGPNGCGTTTHWGRAADYLREEGLEVVQTREPGGTIAGKKLRALLLESDIKFAPRTEYFLFSASRAHNVEQNIIPGLKAGKIILCDRYFTSSTVFQGYAGNEEVVKKIKKINSFATFGVQPDLRFILNIDYKKAQKRLKKIKEEREEGDNFEERDQEFQRKVSKAYKDLTQKLPNTIGLDSTDPKETNARKIRKELQKLIPGLGS